jgi:hypothetical protein
VTINGHLQISHTPFNISYLNSILDTFANIAFRYSHFKVILKERDLVIMRTLLSGSGDGVVGIGTVIEELGFDST